MRREKSKRVNSYLSGLGIIDIEATMEGWQIRPENEYFDPVLAYGMYIRSKTFKCEIGSIFSGQMGEESKILVVGVTESDVPVVLDVGVWWWAPKFVV